LTIAITSLRSGPNSRVPSRNGPGWRGSALSSLTLPQYFAQEFVLNDDAACRLIRRLRPVIEAMAAGDRLEEMCVMGGLSGAGLARFGEIARSRVAESAGTAGDAGVTGKAVVAGDLVPGVVALAGTSEEPHIEAHGALSLGGPPVRPDSQFRIASTTKPITAAVILALAGEGLLDIDEPAGRLLPELASPRVLRRPDGPLDDTVPAARSVTVRDLLTLTFGFGAVPEMYEVAEDWPVVVAAEGLPLATIGPPDPGLQPDPDTWIAALAEMPLIAQPGERWAYNTGSQVLGVLASRAAGLPIDEVYRTRVFEPLGMTPASSRATRHGSRPRTRTRPSPAPPTPAWMYGTRRRGSGQSHRRSVMARAVWSRRRKTSGSSLVCSCAAAMAY
jgi:CubicO group peptidase (beta-lactamase class C family)